MGEPDALDDLADAEVADESEKEEVPTSQQTASLSKTNSLTIRDSLRSGRHSLMGNLTSTVADRGC